MGLPQPPAGQTAVGPWALHASSFPRPSSPASAARPRMQASAARFRGAVPPAPSPRRFQEQAPRTAPVTAGQGPNRTQRLAPTGQRSPFEPSPSEITATNPQVVPLGGGLALVTVGQWDEDTSTIQMPKFTDTPSPGPASPTSPASAAPEPPRAWHDAGSPGGHPPNPWQR